MARESRTQRWNTRTIFLMGTGNHSRYLISITGRKVRCRSIFLSLLCASISHQLTRSEECLNSMGISTRKETKAEAATTSKKDLEAKHQKLESVRQQLELDGQRLEEKCQKNERRLRRVNKRRKKIERKEQDRAAVSHCPQVFSGRGMQQTKATNSS